MHLYSLYTRNLFLGLMYCMMQKVGYNRLRFIVVFLLAPVSFKLS